MKLIPDAMAQTEQPQSSAPAPESAPAASPAPEAAPATPAAPSAPASPPAPSAGKTGTSTGAPSAAPETPSLSDIFAQIVPMLIIVGIVYIIVLRPQQRKQREQQNQLRNVRRGDVVAVGGLIGKVSKVIDDAEFELEIAPNVRTRALRSAITEVRAKGEPVKDVPAAKA
jgi:preprotein translocase subunit YajC